MLIGCCGSGKSTLARAIHEVLKIDLYHLDQYFWQPNWVEMEDSKWLETVNTLAQKEEWIIDGNYGRTMDIRLNRADTIIYLDFSTIKCLWRITKRIIKNHGKVRPDMPAGCKERFDLGFYHYVLIFNLVRRKNILKKLEKLKTQKDIYVLKNDSEVNQFLNSCNSKLLN